MRPKAYTGVGYDFRKYLRADRELFARIISEQIE